MSKDPAFLFYSSDFFSGVQDLTMEERGQYITLLCLQHQKGHMSEKMIKIACHGIAAEDVMAKFRQDPAGLWYNERLDKEINKRKIHSDKQRARAKAGWEKRKKNNSKNNHATAYATAMPLENENENINTLNLYYIKSEENLKKIQDYLKTNFIEISFQDLKKEAESFVLKKEVETDTNKEFSDYQSHFINLVKKNYEINKGSDEKSRMRTIDEKGADEISTTWD